MDQSSHSFYLSFSLNVEAPNPPKKDCVLLFWSSLYFKTVQWVAFYSKTRKLNKKNPEHSHINSLKNNFSNCHHNLILKIVSQDTLFNEHRCS